MKQSQLDSALFNIQKQWMSARQEDPKEFILERLNQAGFSSNQIDIQPQENLLHIVYKYDFMTPFIGELLKKDHIDLKSIFFHSENDA